MGGVVMHTDLMMARARRNHQSHAPVQIILTSGISWTVPSDWNSANNTIECIGAGAYGGGAYARKNNLTLTPGATVAYRIGAPSTTQNTADTWFVNDATVKAQGSISLTGGAASSSVGDVVRSGGNARAGGPPGGGGAAGPNGDGLTAPSSTGGAGDAGLGGAGGISGSQGGNGTEWGTVGSGGGGGYQGDGGLYGGGAGGGGAAQGAPGVIVITYTPA